jgi:hypothetical protein
MIQFFNETYKVQNSGNKVIPRNQTYLSHSYHYFNGKNVIRNDVIINLLHIKADGFLS